jgi:NADP-dependent 3-hydroxy acid dehydrogenase YdfG
MKQTILITGTSSGFGKLTAVTLANAGHNVIATMRDISTKNKDVAGELSAISNIEVVEMDITNDESVTDSINQILLKYDKIDVLVNNAGVSASGVLEAYSIDQIKRLFDTNVFGVFRTYKAVLPSMRKNKSGLIINISSGLGMFSLPNITPYSASKFAVEAFTEGINDEVKPFGIENVSVQAGAYPTDIMKKAGVFAEDQAITQAYTSRFGPQSGNSLAVMIAKMKEFNMNPQKIADGILRLVQMEKGTRPQQFPLDAVAQGADQEFINMRNELKLKWLSNHR